MNRFVVYERTQGGACWTIAFKHSTEKKRSERSGKPDGFGDFDVPADFHLRELAEAFVKDDHSKRLGWWGGEPNQRPMEAFIAEVELPADPTTKE